MPRILLISLLIALIATVRPNILAREESNLANAVTLSGDFMPNDGSLPASHHFTWRVRWHPGMSISTAMHDAAVHPLLPRGEFTVSSAGRSRKVRFPFKKKTDDIALKAGDDILLLYGTVELDTQ